MDGSGLREPRALVSRDAGRRSVMMLAASSARVGFFIYCQLRWGRWDMYMLTQAAGWGIVPDYLAVFKPSSYRWLVPALNDPTEASQMSMTLGALLFVGIAHLRCCRRFDGGPVDQFASASISALLSSITSRLAAWPAWRWKACCATNFARMR